MTAAANPIAADIQLFGTAMQDIKTLVAAVHSGKATINQALTTIDATLKAVAVVAPPVAQFESYVEAAEGVAAVLTVLGILKVEHGPVKPVFGGDAGPERIFGFTPDP